MQGYSTRFTILMSSTLWAPQTQRKGHKHWRLHSVFLYLGVPVAEHKTEGPSPRISFWGILIDTKAFELRLPSDKIERLRTLLQSWGSKKACTRKELESLIGHLSHATSVIRPGRTFLRQLFSLLHIAKAPKHFVCLNAGARADLAWWKWLLRSWNGSSFFLLPFPAGHVFSDASGTYGCEAFVDDLEWFQIKWPEGWEKTDIAVKELVPVVAAAALWGHCWAGKHIRFHSDNMAVVAILSSRTAKTPLLMHLSQCFSFYCAHFRFHFSSKHVPGVKNTAADALSRNNMPLFLSLDPQVTRFNILPSLFSLLISIRPEWGSPAWTQLLALSLTEVLPNLH